MTHPLLPALSDAGIIATLRAPSADTAFRAVETLVEAGISAVEVTYTTPGAGEVIAALAARFGSAVTLGAGTLTEPVQVREAVDAGAAFLVSPGFDEQVYDAIAATDALSMIGGFTPTEVQRLRRVGVDVVKFFPGSLGGPSALKALRGPFPDLVAIPTGGVSADNLGQWFSAGAIAVGAGSVLLPDDAVRDGDAAALAASARSFLDALSRTRAAAA